MGDQNDSRSSRQFGRGGRHEGGHNHGHVVVDETVRLNERRPAVAGAMFAWPYWDCSMSGPCTATNDAGIGRSHAGIMASESRLALPGPFNYWRTRD